MGLARSSSAGSSMPHDILAPQPRTAGLRCCTRMISRLKASKAMIPCTKCPGSPPHQLVSLLGLEVHRQSIGDDQGRPIGGDLRQPAWRRHRGSDHVVVAAFGVERAPQRDDLGVVDVVPGHAGPWVDPPDPGVQPGSQVDHDGLVVLGEKLRRPLSKCLARTATEAATRGLTFAAGSRSPSARSRLRPSCYQGSAAAPGRPMPARTR